MIILTLLTMIIGSWGCGNKKQPITCEEAKIFYDDLHDTSEAFDKKLKLKDKQALINLRDRGRKDCLPLHNIAGPCVTEHEKIDISEQEHKLDCDHWLQNAERDIAKIR